MWFLTACRLKAKVKSAAVVLGFAALITSSACHVYQTRASSRNGEFEWKHGPRTVVVKVLGNVTFANNDQDVMSVSPDGYLFIEESVLWDSWALEFTRRTDGSVGRRLIVNGEEKPVNLEARARMARIFPEVLRRTGINSSERAARILDHQGLDALLEETRLLPRDAVRVRYLQQAADTEALTEDQKLRVVREAGAVIGSVSRKSELLSDWAPNYSEVGLLGGLLEAGEAIGSNSSKSRFARGLFELHCDSADRLRLILDFVKTIGSDSHKATALRAATDCLSGDERSKEAYFAALSSMTADGGKAGVLRDLVQKTGRDEAMLVPSLDAAGALRSDSKKASVLVLASRFFVNTNAVREAYFAASDRIGSSSSRSEALMAVVKNAELDPSSASRLFKSAGQMGSDNAKAAVLIQSLDLYTEDPKVSKEFIGAVNRIGSASRRASVLSTVAQRSGIGKHTLLEVIESAEGLSDDSAKAGILVRVAHIAGNDAEISMRLRLAAKTIRASSSYRRVLSGLDQEASRSE